MLAALVEEIDEEWSTDHGCDDTYGEFCRKKQASSQKVREHEEDSSGKKRIEEKGSMIGPDEKANPMWNNQPDKPNNTGDGNGRRC